MHVSTKDVVTTEDQIKELGVPAGTHILSNTIEADGPFAIASPDATFDTKVIAVRRTESGGVFVQTAVFISEPQPAQAAPAEPAEPALTPEEEAVSYFVGKGFSDEDAKKNVEKYGAAKVLAKRNAELDDELNTLVAPK